MSRRITAADGAVAPVVGVALLVAVTVLAAALVAAVVADVRPPGDPPQVAFSVSADATGAVTLVHEGGDALAARALRVRIAVDGTLLRYQPPVPFVGARGFDGAPAGPFNARAAGRWTAGERAGFRVAGTNAPALVPGARLRVTVYADGHRVASAATRVATARGVRPPPPVPPPLRRVRSRPPPERRPAW